MVWIDAKESCFVEFLVDYDLGLSRQHLASILSCRKMEKMFIRNRFPGLFLCSSVVDFHPGVLFSALLAD